MPAKKKPTKTTKKPVTPPPLDIGLPKSGLISSKKAMDIVPKSKTLPSSSAKPIIVSNRTIVKDPMAPPEMPNELETSTPKLKAKNKIVIAPLHDEVKPGIEATAALAHDKEVDEVTESQAPATKPLLEVHEATQPEDELDDTAEPTIEADSPTELDSRKQDEAETEKNEAAQKTEEFLSSGAEDTVENIKKSTEPKPEELERKRAEKRAEEVAELIESKQ